MSLGALAVTGNAFKRAGAGIPLVHGTPMPFDHYLDGQVPDFLWFERLLEDQGSGLDKPAAVIVETVQGEGGINVARPEWLRGLADLCRAPRHAADRRRHPDGLRPHRAVLLLRGGRHHPGHRHACRSPSAATACRCRCACSSRELDVWEPGRAQRHLPRQQPGVRHRHRRPGRLLGATARWRSRPWPGASRSSRRCSTIVAPSTRRHRGRLPRPRAGVGPGVRRPGARLRGLRPRLRARPADGDLRARRARSSSCCRR